MPNLTTPDFPRKPVRTKQAKNRFSGGLVFTVTTKGDMGKVAIPSHEFEKFGSSVELSYLKALDTGLRSLALRHKLDKGRYRVCITRSRSANLTRLCQELQNDFDQLEVERVISPPSSIAERRKEIVQAEIDDAYKAYEVEELMRVRRSTVQNRRKAKDLLGIKIGNGYVYPRWQFGDDGQPFPVLGEVLRALACVTDSPTEMIALLNDKRDFFGKRSIKDLILEGRSEDAATAAIQFCGGRI